MLMNKNLGENWKKKLFEIFFWKLEKEMNFKKEKKKIKILGAKNCRKNLHKQSGPPFQIRGGPGCFSIAQVFVTRLLLELC